MEDKRMTGTKPMMRMLVLILGATALLGTVAAAPARADDDWHHGDHHDWREHERREHEARERQAWCAYHPYACDYRPGYAYAPPPVVYAPPPAPPPPVVYAPAPALSIVLPIHIR
jgi:hypothetical protein